MTINGVIVSAVSTFVANGDVQTRVVTISGADGTRYAERDIDLGGGAPAGSFAGHPFGHPGDSDDTNQALWSGVANSAAGHIIAAVARASTDAALTSTDAEALDEVALLSDTLEQMAGKSTNSGDQVNVGATEAAATWCGAGVLCPRVQYWNYVCSSSASMWPNHYERGNAPYELMGNQDIYHDAVYVYDIQYGRRAAHVTALMGPDNKGGPPFPERRVSGYLNMTGNLCACPRNAPISCSPYRD
jgi:hypothetical protein